MAEGLMRGRTKAWETIIPIFRDQNIAPVPQEVPGTILDEDEHKYVTLDNDESWYNFFKLQNNVSTNVTNTKNAKPYVQKNDDGMYIYTARDETKYNGKYIIGQIAEKIQAEMLKSLGSDTVKSIALKESKDEDGTVGAAARIVLSGSTKLLNISSLINGDRCERYNVDSITFCLPDKSKTRGIRCRFVEGVMIYEVANGEYVITLNWYAEGTKCTILVSVKDDGSVKLLERYGVTDEQLRAHKEVKVGRQYEAKFLYEALMGQ